MLDRAAPIAERGSFNPPAEPEWHRMISEAAYLLAEKRAFAPGSALDDWLRAEQAVHDALRPNFKIDGRV